MGLNLGHIPGQTPIEEEEKEGLLVSTIATKGELDEFEQKHIEEALQWVMSKRFKVEQVFTEKFIRDLHKRMFGKIWSWAGQYRRSEKNLGIDSFKIPLALKTLCDDALYWYENDTYLPKELAIRFKHRIVSIHCFANGNGRHSRLMGDLIIEKIYSKEPFSWGTADLVHEGDARKRYLSALKKADKGDIRPLIDFAGS